MACIGFSSDHVRAILVCSENVNPLGQELVVAVGGRVVVVRGERPMVWPVRKSNVGRALNLGREISYQQSTKTAEKSTAMSLTYIKDIGKLVPAPVVGVQIPIRTNLERPILFKKAM